MLKNLHDQIRKDFHADIVAILLALVGYSILFSTNWRIGLAVTILLWGRG